MGCILQTSNLSSDLLLAAELYLSLGWSVIPLYGDADPTRAKVAAVPWSSYQSRRATLLQARHWFTEQGHQGIAIVTGRLSNLIVLDFDDPELFLIFSQQYPHLVAQQVIQTRRGYHIHFQLSPSLSIPTRKGRGIDLLSDGCYAVARPTLIEGLPYKLLIGAAPKRLNSHDLAHITTFFDQHSHPSTHLAVGEGLKPPPTTVYPGTGDDEGRKALREAPLQAISPTPERVLSSPDIQMLYRAQISNGRNQALFNVALTARDHGWSKADALAALVDLHVHTPARGLHSSESERQRQREAARTISSAFSRPARPPQPLPTISPQLPTRVRECLYAHKLTCVVRVIEGLREKGIQPGQIITRQQAQLLLSGIVGRDSIHMALHATAPDGQPLFEPAAPPLEPPPASVDAADENAQRQKQKCIFVSTTKSGKMISGRKSYLYTMPSNSILRRKLGIRFWFSDPFQIDDLTSAKKTRQAAHRELIKRRPSQYPRLWLAKRLGVSIRTTQRYDQELRTLVKPMYTERLITWTNLNDVPDFPVNGSFLQDENNRRYPALREIAARLLAKGHIIDLKQQQANFYSLDLPSIVSTQVWKLQQTQQAQTEQGRAEIIPHTPSQPAARPLSSLLPPEPDLKPIPSKAHPKPAPRLTKRRARQPLPDAHQEALAQRVYKIINARTPDPQNHISQATARHCVVTYGTKAVESAVKLLLSRRNIVKPAGFFLTILRSENRKH